MPSKFFNVNKPEQVVTITEDKDKFYKLSDGNMIKKDTFMQKYQPVLEDINESTQAPTTAGNSTLDPDAFFKSGAIPEDVVSGIKQADPTKAAVEGQNRTEVVHKSPDQMTRKAPSTNDVYNESLVTRIPDTPGVPNIPNNTNTDVSQYKVYDDDEEAFADFQKKQGGQQPQQKPQPSDIEKKKAEIEDLFLDEKMALGEEEAIKRRSKRLLRLPTNQPEKVDGPGTELNAEYREPAAPQMNAIELMFSTFKRKHPITVNVEFTDMIGEPDFVKLMVENMDGDIVGYYKKKVMENIMKDLSQIEKAVEATIKHEIFGDEEDEDEKLMKNFEKNKEGYKDLVKRTLEPTEPILVPGGVTKAGKQKYKYVDENGKVKELLPGSAKAKGYEPYKK